MYSWIFDWAFFQNESIFYLSEFVIEKFGQINIDNSSNFLPFRSIHGKIENALNSD